MQWNAQLNRVARAHAVDMRDSPCFQHPSCDGTDAFARIRSVYTGPWTHMAENISAGIADGRMVVTNWINEIGVPAGETGHRDNIFSPDFTLLGVGFAPGGTEHQNYWTQDFVGTPNARQPMTDGIHVVVDDLSASIAARTGPPSAPGDRPLVGAHGRRAPHVRDSEPAKRCK